MYGDVICRHLRVLGLLFVVILLFIYSTNMPSDTSMSRQISQKTDPNDDISLSMTNLSQGISNQQVVLLVTYLRGGSSFLGQVFAHNPKAFYWFEPLRAQLRGLNSLAEIAHDSRIIENAYYEIPGNKTRDLPLRLTRARLDALCAVAMCDIRNVDPTILEDEFMRLSPLHGTKSHYLCLKQQQRQNGSTTNQCTSNLYRSCKNHSVVVIKTTRTPLYLIPQVIANLPNVKVIYFTRDPRGMFASRSNMPKFSNQGINSVKRLCLRMHADFRHYVRISLEFPDQILWVKYEDLSTSPLSIIQKMYNFVGIPMASSLTSWISAHTQSKRGAHGFFGTVRNSSETSYKWRHMLSAQTQIYIVGVCKGALRSLQYL